MHWATAHRRGKTFGLSTAFAAEIGGLERKMRADGPALQLLYPFSGKSDRGHAFWFGTPVAVDVMRAISTNAVVAFRAGHV